MGLVLIGLAAVVWARRQEEKAEEKEQFLSQMSVDDHLVNGDVEVDEHEESSDLSKLLCSSDANVSDIIPEAGLAKVGTLAFDLDVGQEDKETFQKMLKVPCLDHN